MADRLDCDEIEELENSGRRPSYQEEKEEEEEEREPMGPGITGKFIKWLLLYDLLTRPR